MTKKLYFFVGTTAEFVKIAPIIKELQERKIKFKVITSGQTRIFFNEFADYIGNISPDIAFREKLQRPSVLFFGIWVFNTFLSGIFRFKKEFDKYGKSDVYVIIHGDTASSFLGAILAKIYGLKVVHIESGLRSYSFLEPFPEELLRCLNMRLADVLFCPNEWARENIKKLKGEKIVTGQNTMIESYWWSTKNRKRNSAKKLGSYYLLYIRRQEHVYFKKAWVRRVIQDIVTNANKNLSCIFVLNFLSVRFLEDIKSAMGKNAQKRLITISRTPYDQFMKIMKHAEFIATDGCTNQEDAYYVGIPLLALRNRTERTEGLGENIVISKGDTKIIKNFLRNYRKYKRKPIQVKRRPSKIIVDYLLSH